MHQLPRMCKRTCFSVLCKKDVYDDLDLDINNKQYQTQLKHYMYILSTINLHVYEV